MGWKTLNGFTIPEGFPVVAWDLDSTVRNTVHRRYLLPAIRAGEATWDDYSMLCADDPPIPGTVKLVRLMDDAGYANIAISGASGAALELTRQWCRKYEVPMDDFVLRPEGDHTPNGVWKTTALDKLKAAGLDVQLFVEDWEAAAKYIAAETGIPVLGINPFDEDAVTTTQDELGEVFEASWPHLPKARSAELAEDVFTELKKRRQPQSGL